MEYYNDGEIIIRDLEERDIAGIVEGELAQGWHSVKDKYEMRLKDSREGRSVAFAAEYRGEIAGYINLYRSAGGAFSGKGIPEIVDFGVLEKFRCRGIGGRLMDIAEQAAGKYSGTVCLGVGLHSGYGSAQRMYVKRGYIPDGSGVWYRDSVCGQHADCRNDDDLVMYMSKELKAPRSFRSGYMNKEENMNIWEELYSAAKYVQNNRKISDYVDAGGVSAAVLSASGKIYTGVCIDTCSTLGICAERNAIFNMITNGESEISKVLAIMPDGRAGAPCGACRELMVQLMPKKYKGIEIMLDYENMKTITLGELTPEWWIK